MKNEKILRSAVSLKPLLEFWEKNLIPQCDHMDAMFRELKEKIAQHPEIRNNIKEIGILSEYKDILSPLMSVVFPPSSFHRDIMGAISPCSFEPFFVTPKFQQLFLDNENFTKPMTCREQGDDAKESLKLYFLILERIYGINFQPRESMDIRIVPDQATGLDRYYSITADCQFVRISPLTQPPPLSENDRAAIKENLTDIGVLASFIDLTLYEFTGFTIVKAVDVTESQVLSALERDLVDQQAIFSSQGIELLEKRIKVLFQRPNLSLGIAALQNDQVMIIKNDCDSNINCLFSNSHHISLDQVQGSVWMKAAEGKSVLRVADLAKKNDPVDAEEQAVSAGIRSMLLSPLIFQDQTIGLIEVFSPVPNELGPIDAMLLEQVTPVFAMALKRGLEEMDKHVQSIIKEKCTAVHPSVEWRFEAAALSHMERLRHGITSSEMEPIVFKNVIPFYGQSDIRGSSLARNKGITQDLTDQLALALNVIDTAAQLRPWPILQEYQYRIKTRISEIATGLTPGHESEIFSLLNSEIAPVFRDLNDLGPQVRQQIDVYTQALDTETGMVYNKRKAYEQSVSTLNKTLAGFMEKEDRIIQQSFPHYFEKRQTDGVDYMMYAGDSMMATKKLASFHIQDLTLWQLMLSWGLAWHTEQVKPQLKVPLDTCHLILVNHTPLSIRFRFDEKRFDVDGAYDVRHEIIKSRLDKALVKGSGERLTQPGRIAVVYATTAEGRKIRQHMDFLTSQGKLENDLEMLDLDGMEDVRGLKALRVGVDLKSAGNNIIEMKTG